MIEDQAHGVLKILEFRGLYLFDLVVGYFALSHQSIELLCGQVLELQAQTFGYI